MYKTLCQSCVNQHSMLYWHCLARPAHVPSKPCDFLRFSARLATISCIIASRFYHSDASTYMIFNLKPRAQAQQGASPEGSGAHPTAQEHDLPNLLVAYDHIHGAEGLLVQMVCH